MKRKMKKMSLVGSTIGLLGIFLIGINGSADEKRVYIPSGELRNGIINQIETEEPIEDELPTISQLHTVGSWFTIQEQNDGAVTSLEGIQYLKNVEGLAIYHSSVTDFRPVAQMKKLKDLSIYYGRENDAPNEVEIDFIKDLVELEQVTIAVNDFGVLDLRPLSNLPELNLVKIGGRVKSEAPVPVSKQDQTAIVANPVTYSSQFVGNFDFNVRAFVEDHDGDLDIIAENNIFHLSNIPEDANQLVLEIQANTADNIISHQVMYIMDIMWY